jgi:predicted RNA-binding Zn-ribbon protein involved in translation (DUF1610 family)
MFGRSGNWLPCWRSTGVQYVGHEDGHEPSSFFSEVTMRHETFEKQCPHCGSLYRVTKWTTAMRDKDSIVCSVCRKELMSWNGAVFFEETLVTAAKIPKKSSN